MTDGIECYAPAVAETFIRAAPEFCKECPEAIDGANIIKAVNKNIVGPDLYDGKLIFEFYNTMRQLVNPNVPPLEPGLGSFYRDVLVSVRAFAPVLLAGPDQFVRFQTQALLQDLIFIYPPMADISAEEPTDLEILRTKWLRILFKACRKKAGELLEIDTIKHHLQPVVSTLLSCIQYLELVNALGSCADMLKSDEDQGFFDSYLSKCGYKNCISEQC
jgi:hypothetical protein